MARLLAVFVLCLHALLAIAADAPAANPAVSPIAIPALKARVTDLTATLTAAQAAELEAKLADFEARKGSQLAVLILPGTAPETIEAFAIRLMDAWKIGRKGVDDGVILIVAKDERRLRIEVGYGLEGVLNDATAKRIIDETITPALKSGDLPGGISAGAAAILAAVDQENLPEAETAPGVATPGGGMLDFDNIGENTFLLGLAFLAIGGAALRFFLGNLLGSGLVGGVTAGLGWLFTGSIVGALIGAAAGFFIALFGMDLLLSGIFSGGSGGSGGGGGFSGGGGGGGGGGASGSW